MPTDTANPMDAYLARFRKIFVFIDANPDGELTVENLSRMAAFSKFHFHRQFSSRFGISLFDYLRLIRLKRASFRLAFRADDPVTDIAFDSGYESPEAFARAFKQRFGQTPTEFRAAPDWSRWHAEFQPFSEARSLAMPTETTAPTVTIRNFQETRVAVLEHQGDPRRLGDSIRRFIEWRKENKLHPSRSATFNLVYDDIEGTDPAEYRFDLCAAITGPVAENDFGVFEKVIPGGRCAVIRHVGPDQGLDPVVRRLYGEWLPASGEALRDFPLFFQRVSFFPDVPESEMVTDIFLPLA